MPYGYVDVVIHSHVGYAESGRPPLTLTPPPPPSQSRCSQSDGQPDLGLGFRLGLPFSVLSALPGLQ